MDFKDTTMQVAGSTSHEDDTSANNMNEKAEFADAQTATAKEHNLTLAQALKAYPKAIAWSILLSSAVVMEGYDTVLVSNNIRCGPGVSSISDA